MTRYDKEALLQGAVRPWHIVFLFAVFFCVAVVASFKLTLSAPAALRMQFRDIVAAAFMGGFVALVTAIVPEFRRALPALFRRQRWKARDLLLALGLMLAWAYGLYLVAFVWPAVVRYPQAFQLLHLADSLPEFDAKYLLLLFATVGVAPIAEELVFRGYLLNLWHAKWGYWPAILLSSIVFGLFHFEKTIATAASGAILAMVYLRYDSLWPGVVLHAVFNLTSFPWLLPRLFYVRPQGTVAHVSSWIPEIILAAVFVPLCVMFWRRFKPCPTSV